MKREDVARQHEFNHYRRYTCWIATTHVLRLSRQPWRTSENSMKRDDNRAHFAIEADGKYIGGITR